MSVLSGMRATCAFCLLASATACSSSSAEVRSHGTLSENGAASSTTGNGGASSADASAATGTTAANPTVTGVGGSSITLHVDPTDPAGGSGGMDTCGAESHQADLKPLAMHLLVDQSISMTEFDDRWTPVSTAIQTFVSDPASEGMEVGMGYFPYWTTMTSLKCDPVSYQAPDVPIGLLPDNAAQVTASLGGKMFPCCGDRPAERGSTPTRPAYEGSVEYLRSYLETNPDHVGVLVMATDGEPTDCQNNDIADTVAAITAAASGTPPIPTYVIGISNVANLDQFAAAGGTGRGPFIVDGTGVNTQQEFLDAMQEIRGAALPCEFDIPTPTNGVFDDSLVNVDYDPGDGTGLVPLYRVNDQASCDAAGGGWYYDNPAAPSTIQLCESTCSTIAAVDIATVSVSLGCATRIR